MAVRPGPARLTVSPARGGGSTVPQLDLGLVSQSAPYLTLAAHMNIVVAKRRHFLLQNSHEASAKHTVEVTNAAKTSSNAITLHSGKGLTSCCLNNYGWTSPPPCLPVWQMCFVLPAATQGRDKRERAREDFIHSGHPPKLFFPRTLSVSFPPKMLHSSTYPFRSGHG